MIMTHETAPEVRAAEAVWGRQMTMLVWIITLRTKQLRSVPKDLTLLGNVPAQVDAGRWLVKCPFCKGALLASKRERWFWCAECGMSANQGRPMQVIFPKESIMLQIETILEMRPDRFNQNWLPTESVSDLARENLEHHCVQILRT